MDVIEIRRRNLVRLTRERGALRQLSIDIGTAESHLSQLRKGKRAMGHTIARKIEKARELGEGWMDHDHAEEDGMVTQDQVVEVLESIQGKEVLNQIPYDVFLNIIKNLQRSGLRGEELRETARTVLTFVS